MNVPPGATRATLRKASEALRQQEEERRERYVAEVTALGYGERDIALAAYDGEAAGDAIVALAEDPWVVGDVAERDYTRRVLVGFQWSTTARLRCARRVKGTLRGRWSLATSR